MLDDVFVGDILGVRDAGRARELGHAIRRMLWTPGNPPLPPPGQGDGIAGGAGLALFARRRAPVDRLLAEEIAERRARGHGSRRDVIGAVVGDGSNRPASA